MPTNKDNSGVLWINERKEKETHADRTGDALIDGVRYYLDGWINKKPDGTPYLSIKFKRVESKSPATTTATTSNEETPF